MDFDEYDYLERTFDEFVRDQRTVFAYQICLTAEYKDVYDFFSIAGKVRHVRLLTDSSSSRFKGLGYIEFQDARSVPMAIALDGQPLCGQALRVKPLESEKNLVQSSPYSGVARRLYISQVSDLSPSARRKEIHAIGQAVSKRAYDIPDVGSVDPDPELITFLYYKNLTTVVDQELRRREVYSRAKARGVLINDQDESCLLKPKDPHREIKAFELAHYEYLNDYVKIPKHKGDKSPPREIPYRTVDFNKFVLLAYSLCVQSPLSHTNVIMGPIARFHLDKKKRRRSGALLFNADCSECLVVSPTREGDDDEQCWNPPKGKVEVFEDIRMAANREVQEEINLDISKLTYEQYVDKKIRLFTMRLYFFSNIRKEIIDKCKLQKYEIRAIKWEHVRNLVPTDTDPLLQYWREDEVQYHRGQDGTLCNDLFHYRKEIQNFSNKKRNEMKLEPFFAVN